MIFTKLFFTFALLVPSVSSAELNNRPIIGVLAETTRKSQLKYGYSFISASYVKFIELGGARVVPVLLDRPDSYYENIFNSINGLLIPGGGQDLEHSEYQRISSLFFEKSIEAKKKNGDHFPILAICLGFEILNVWAAKNISVITYNHAKDVALPLDVDTYGNYNKSKLFQKMPKEIFEIFTTKNVTSNYHQKGIRPEDFKKFGNDKILRILSVNESPKDNSTFISTVDAKDYPIYGLQWHPEKNIFIFSNSSTHKYTPHDNDAVISSQYIANFFVNECRQSSHKFSSYDEEIIHLIYNYNPIYSGKEGYFYEQMYIFDKYNPQDKSSSTLPPPQTTPSIGNNLQSCFIIPILFLILLSKFD